MTDTSQHPDRTGSRPLRSTRAVLVGFLSVAVLSLATDQVLHVLDVYPPWGVPMNDPLLNLLALAYRVVFTTLGGAITARLAPREPMRHVFVLGAIGTALASAGAAVAIAKASLGPTWFPVALVLTALPCTWLGGLVQANRRPERPSRDAVGARSPAPR